MSKVNEIRADFDGRSIVVYQAYNDAIADAAVEAQKFVPPFSMARMTWIKPSFLWLMERSNWGQKSGQTRILAVRISREGFEEALSLGILTSFEKEIHLNSNQWRSDFEKALVHIQWDPERSIRGADLGVNSIQIGLGRHIIEKFVDEWTSEISDMTPTVRKIHSLIKAGKMENARRLLPVEKPCKVSAQIGKRIGM